mmetsp:Transcript_6381/g.18678  ORF Transcript_6381/g.18678 Transcript_6381/m.18678 type:complete len:89 (+) Transcript_6381:2977-3243(+)
MDVQVGGGNKVSTSIAYFSLQYISGVIHICEIQNNLQYNGYRGPFRNNNETKAQKHAHFLPGSVLQPHPAPGLPCVQLWSGDTTDCSV